MPAAGCRAGGQTRATPAGRFGRGHAGKADERGDADRDGADDRKEELPDAEGIIIWARPCVAL
jgi:hypothetical protein